MLKILGVGLLVCTILGMLLIFPFAAIGTGIAIFCLWRGWYIAALIFFLVGVSIQLCRGITSDDGNGYGYSDSDYSDYEDHDGDGDDWIGFPEMYVSYKYGESQREKHKND